MFGKGILPDNILIRIFSHLDIYQLMKLRPVSMHWSKLVTASPELMQHLDLSGHNRRVTDQVLIDIILPFIGTRPRTVDISNCFHITDEGFAALASQCSANARCWKMKSVWDITAHAILEMSNKAKDLEEIDLSNCRKVSDTLLARIVGWVVDEQMNIDSAAAAQRQRLSNGRTKNGGQAPAQLPPGTVVGCPKLKSLTLSYCKHVTDRSMAHLAVYAAGRLESIDLTRCTTITDNGFQHWSIYNFTNLRRLCLADCTYLTDNAIVYLTNAAKGLRDLDLVGVFFFFSLPFACVCVCVCVSLHSSCMGLHENPC
jgi:F-box/leucine-rich repeat protein 7